MPAPTQERGKRPKFNPALIAEMRRLRGLNHTFTEIAEMLNKQGFRNSDGGLLMMNTIAYLFKKTADVVLDGSAAVARVPEQDLIDVILRSDLQADVKIKLIHQVRSGELTDLNYRKSDIPKDGGRVFEQGNLANPAATVRVTLGPNRLKQQCKLLLHFIDELKVLAEG